MRKIKRVITAFLISLFLPLSVTAQAAVIDVSAIAAAIENGITMYKQLQNAYNQYKAMVDQIVLIGKDMIQFDPRDYDWKQWDAILKLTDHYMTQMDNIESIINKKSMIIGGLKFSMKDLYTTDFYSRLDGELNDKLNPDNMSDWDKQMFYRRHGLSIKHYNKLKALSSELHDNAVETAARVSVMEEEDEVVMQQIQDFKEATESTSGTVDNLQLAAKIQAQTLQEAKEISIMIRSLTENAMQMNVLNQTEKEIEKEQIEEQNNASNTPFSDFYKQGGDDSNLIGPGEKL